MSQNLLPPRVAEGFAIAQEARSLMRNKLLPLGFLRIFPFERAVSTPSWSLSEISGQFTVWPFGVEA
jgi:hypothetical protein